jgi:hypothetical protein
MEELTLQFLNYFFVAEVKAQITPVIAWTYNVNPNSIGRAFMIKSNTGTCTSWRMFRYNHNRSGYLPKADKDAVCSINTQLTDLSLKGSQQLQIQPNPFTETFSIQVTERTSEPVTISIFDLSGKLLYSEIQNIAQLKQNGSLLHCYAKLEKGAMYFFP